MIRQDNACLAARAVPTRGSVRRMPGKAFARSRGVCRIPQGVTIGDMIVSILRIGPETTQLIHGIESRYRIGGKDSMSLAFATACFGEVSIPQAASDGSVRAEASKAVIRFRIDASGDGIFVLLRTSGANALIQDHLILLSFENLSM